MKIYKFKMDLKTILYMVSIVFITYLVILNYKVIYLPINNIDMFLSELFFIFKKSEVDLYSKILTFITLVVTINIFIIINLSKHTINYNRFILYRTINIKDLMKYKYINIVRYNIFSILIFTISMFIIGYNLSNSKILGTTFEFSISYKSIIMLFNFFLIQVFTVSLVSIIFNVNNYLTLVYIIILYSIFIIIDKCIHSFSFLFNDNNLLGGTVVLLLFNLYLYLFRDINKYLDY